MKKKPVLLALLLISLSFCAQAQSNWNREMIESWKSDNSSDLKAETAEKFSKGKYAKKASIPDEYAREKMIYDAGQHNTADIRMKIYGLDAHLPNMSDELDSMYPTCRTQYDSIAEELGIKTYVFTMEPTDRITFAHLQAKDGPMPSLAIERFHWYSVRIMREIYLSENMLISRDFNEMINLYNSLDDSIKLIAIDKNYPAFWDQVRDCYSMKYNDSTCLCAKLEDLKLPQIRNCGTNHLVINEEFKGADVFLSILKRLRNGDMSAIKEAKDLKLDVWSEINDPTTGTIVKKLIFLQLKVMGLAQTNSRMIIDISKKFKEAERNKRDGYYTKAGFTEANVAEQEDHFSCLNNMKSADLISTAKAEIKIPKTSEQNEKIASDPYRPDDKKSSATPPKPSGNEYKSANKQIKGQTEVIISRKPAPGTMSTHDYMNWYRDTMQTIVEKELKRLQSGACAKVENIADTAISITMKDCGEKAGTFGIKKTETELGYHFFIYVSNAAAEILALNKTGFAKNPRLAVIATADKLAYKDNYGLAKKRGEFVKNSIGDEMNELIGGNDKITIIPLINQDNRIAQLLITMTPTTK
ncbi:MAG: hypothetical protein JWM20_1000 [Patescibacteria group bacterium]|nr:hypothetical protein [Patescibacteria group bacterium]